jgi:glycogen debranching enzyme
MVHESVFAEQYYIQAQEAPADERPRVLKQGDTFALFNRFGDIELGGMGEQGLYHEGTRFLSRMLLTIAGHTPLLLSSTVRQDNVLMSADLTNPDLVVGDTVVLPHGSLHVYRARFLWQGVWHERLHLRSYHLAPADVSLELRFDADYEDIFEVRGARRPRRGRRLPDRVERAAVLLSYAGLDNAIRCTRIAFDPAPELINGSEVRFRFHLRPHQEVVCNVTVGCECDGVKPVVDGYNAALTEAGRWFRAPESETCPINSSNGQFNEWIERSKADLNMLVTQTPFGPYPYAGVPWFSTPFGRDGIITALEFLWFKPEIARGVLAYLAATQATELNPEQDAEPGKILHETRKGEMAALKEIPFGRYYGSIDSTPLFVLLAGAYWQRTADLEFLRSIWPNLEAALHWIGHYGDSDGDGFVEYRRRSHTGLVQQGWKDSHDSVFHQDGRLAEPPIALCEVQGYVYAAKLSLSAVADALGYPERAALLRSQAERLRDQFQAAFWCPDIGMYALALDGEKRLCRVRSSNAGHCLYTGIAAKDHARSIADALLSDDFFSGWGVRTIAATEARYNPMSYHNGSIWPHDNAMIAAGLARYGYTRAALKILTGLFDVSLFVDLHRVPELFCGFSRRPGKGPTLYPVACSPQAWAAGAPFLLLEACLGMSVDALERRVRLRRAALPATIDKLQIRNLKIGGGSLGLGFHRYPQEIGVNVESRQGDIEVVAIK